jgi:PAS domain S-box-containing protein
LTTVRTKTGGNGTQGPDEAFQRLEHLYAISKILTHIQSVEETVNAVINLIALSLPLRTAIAIYQMKGLPATIAWAAPGFNPADRKDAEAYALAAFSYLMDLAPTKRLDESPQFIFLPLVVENRPIFGVLLVEPVSRLSEQDLMFVNAVANQLAIALEWFATLEARQSSAEARTLSAEQRRDHAESKTQVAEQCRDLAESKTQVASQSQVLAESKTKVAEQSQVLAESKAKTAEQSQVLAESKAKTAEQSQVLAEAKAQAAEQCLLLAEAKTKAAQRQQAKAESKTRAAEFRQATAEDARERFQALVDNLDRAFVWAMDARTFQMSYVSAAVGDLLGFPLQQWFTAPDFLGQCIHPDDRDTFRQTLTVALTRGENQRCEHRILTAQGRVLWFHTGIHPVAGQTGTPQIQGASTDITEKKELEEQSKKMAVLEETDRLKNEFLGILSHELRTPINAITGFGSVLVDDLVGKLSADQRKYVGKMLLSADALLVLVNDLLDMSRIQAGKFTVAMGTIDFPLIVTDVMASLTLAAETKREMLLNDVPLTLPLFVADEQRVAQVLSNLVSNAIKFTTAGGTISVRAWCVEGFLRCEVRDTGIGIAAEHLPKLFDAFVQVDMSNTRRAGGTGLGLSIVKALVKAHGGVVGVESEEGKGSMFYFTLPLVQPVLPTHSAPLES